MRAFRRLFVAPGAVGVVGLLATGAAVLAGSLGGIADTPVVSAAPSRGALAGGTIMQLQVGGVAGVPTDAAAAVLNVTVTNTSAPGFLTVYPCGLPRPLASNLNYTTDQTVPNLVVAKLGSSGAVCIYSMVTTDVIADVSGYFPVGSGYAAVENPARLLDTRVGKGAPAARVGAGREIELQVGGAGGVPADASAAALNVTVTNPAGPGFLTVYPCGASRPLASNLNYTTNQTVPNLVLAKLGAGGKVCIYALAATDVVADVSGYFPAGSGFSPVPNPSRLLDTRIGVGASAVAKVPASGVLQLQVGGAGGVPGDAAAAALNVTVTNPAAAGFVTVYPCGVDRPLASNLNYVAGLTVPNLAVVRLGTAGKVCIYSLVATDVVADVSGYFPAGSGYVAIDNPTRIVDTRDR